MQSMPVSHVISLILLAWVVQSFALSANAFSSVQFDVLRTLGVYSP